MLTVIIATHESENALVPTLAALVSGAAAGIVREVIVADAGSQDQTAVVADVAGCHLMVLPGALGPRLAAAAAAARGAWLMFLEPGVVPEMTWVAEVARFVEQAELSGEKSRRAAVFRAAEPSGTPLALLREAYSLVRAALGARPRPEQGLLISAQLYRELGGHRPSPVPAADLLSRLGRRRISVLRSAAVLTRVGRYS